jgi:hypothetical protein
MKLHLDGPAAVLVLVASAASGASGTAAGQEVTGALREGIYVDTDHTQVFRTLAAVEAAWSGLRLSAKESVDVVSSASLDVRSSAALDAVSSASAGAPKMSDRRLETVVGVSYDDGGGHAGAVNAVYATERDYTSIGAAVSGSWDLAARNFTLLAGAHVNHDLITSIIDPTLSEQMDEVGYSAGLAQVLSTSDVLRLRYDGSYENGYQASPYRTVRFGDWVTTAARRTELITFTNTIGPAAGLPETVPSVRVRHAGVLEWLHGFSADVALLAQVRVARDSWGLLAGTAGADLRVASDPWQLRIAYRFYLQSAADFFQDKYLLAPENYSYYTSDKELGDERGHIGSLEVSYALKDWPADGHTSAFDVQIDVLRYDYPGFTLLPSRTSFFGAVGLRLDL